MLRHVRKALPEGGPLFPIPHAQPEAACLPAERKEPALFYQIGPEPEILHILPVTGVCGKQPFHTVIFAISPRRCCQPCLPVSSRRTIRRTTAIREKSICHAQGKIQILPYPFRTKLAFFLQKAAETCQDFRAVLPLQKSRVADNGQPFALFPLFP